MNGAGSGSLWFAGGAGFWHLAALAVIALGAVGLFYRIDELPRLDLDEGCWLLMAQRAAAGGDPGAASNYSVPVLRWWAQLMLRWHDGADLFLLRLLPALLTLLLLLLLWRTAHAWYGARNAWFVVCLAALCPFTLAWGRLFRTPYLLIAICNVLILHCACTPGGGRSRWFILPAAFLAATLLHPVGFMLAPGLLLVAAVARRGELRRHRRTLAAGLGLAALLLGAMLAYNAELLGRIFADGAIAEKLARGRAVTMLPRLLTIARAPARVLEPGWVLSGMGHGEQVTVLPGSDWLAVAVAVLAVLGALRDPDRRGLALLVILAGAMAGITGMLFASTHLGYAWAFEDPQMQRFFIPLAPLIFMLVGRMFARWRLPAGIAGLGLLLIVWLSATGQWLTENPAVTARSQWTFYRDIVTTMQAQPALNFYTDSWEAYAWVQAIGGETPRVLLLRQERYTPGYMHAFLDNLVRYSVVAEWHACERPGLYAIRQPTRCAVPEQATHELGSGYGLLLFSRPGR